MHTQAGRHNSKGSIPVNIEEITKAFAIGSVNEMKVLTAGHINLSIKITAGTGAFLLQRINTDIFMKPYDVMENIEKVLTCIPSLHLVKTIDDGLLFHDESGYYRCYNFIDNSVSYDVVSDEAMAYRMGDALKRFHSALSAIDGSALHETIPSFHDMFFRFSQFDEAVEKDRAGRLSSVKDEVRFMNDNRKKACIISKLYREGKLPVHVTHNDTKLSNVLFDKDSGEYITFIDLDTVMPGTFLFDTGDMIRSSASTAREDENPDDVHFSPDLYHEIRRGYFDGNDSLTELEKSLFALSGRTITFIMALRFLTDYLNGDVYYHTDYSEHNLVRARNQIRLVKDMDEFFSETGDYDV